MFIRGISLAILTFLLDQWSKWYVFGLLHQAGEIIEVTPFFNLVMVENRGISFGLFNNHDYSAVIFSVLGVIISAVLLVWLWRTHSGLLAYALGFIIGGAIGNVIDRIRFGAVADFLDFHVIGYHWPAFNIADSAIFIGAVMLCFDAIVEEKRAKTKQDTP